MTKNAIDEKLPHWELSNIFPGIDSKELENAIAAVDQEIEELEGLTKDLVVKSDRSARDLVQDIGAISIKDHAATYLNRMNSILAHYGTIRSYIYCISRTDSYNQAAKKLLSETDSRGVRIRKLEVRFRSWIRMVAQHSEAWQVLLNSSGIVGEHRFFLEESLEQSHYLMSETEESLAAELNVSGANAWSRLHNVICSQLKAPFSRDGETVELPVTIIRTYLGDADDARRQQAYEAELAAWETLREPLAACLNGIKGTVSTLDRRRGRPDPLHHTLDQARIDSKILDALLQAMQESFPSFRRYWKAKAHLLGKQQLPWWDLFAPLGRMEDRLSFDEARDFILEQFASFSNMLVEFSERAFDKGWIDAEPRDGKTGGGFCIYIPDQEESRILVNFDGTMDLVMTIAHELGHAYHNECLRGKSQLQRRTPMTLAETASIFNQSIITDAVLNHTRNQEEELAILETFLIDASQVVVDIYSRYLFETAVFERREKAELSADELCDIMVESQKATYGDGLDHRHLNPYMWTWKPHYYSPDRSFYNFPYAFGLLFGLGLFEIYEKGEGDFVDHYDLLLSSTGDSTAVELAARFDIDLRSPAFWRNGIRKIEERIDRYVSLGHK